VDKGSQDVDERGCGLHEKSRGSLWIRHILAREFTIASHGYILPAGVNRWGRQGPVIQERGRSVIQVQVVGSG
jgi:hypothetical protein